MKKKNLIAAGLGFLIVVIAAYFGASIYNSQANSPIAYLNEMDQIYYYDPALIPFLNFKAAIITLPFILGVLIIEILILRKTTIRQVKNIAIGLLVAILIILTTAILTLLNPTEFNLSVWGYVWICLGLFVVAGNLISVFIKGNTDL